jgi:transcription elongation GreA/GreB family factor
MSRAFQGVVGDVVEFEAAGREEEIEVLSIR